MGEFIQKRNGRFTISGFILTFLKYNKLTLINKAHYLVIGIFLLSFACKKKVENSVIPPTISNTIHCNDTSNISYSKTIQPILNTNCVRCHDASTSQNFTTFAGTKPFATSGILIDCITGSNGEILMPPINEPKLDSCTIKVIKKWIKEGCNNN
jgi:hypothetical protein